MTPERKWADGEPWDVSAPNGKPPSMSDFDAAIAKIKADASKPPCITPDYEYFRATCICGAVTCGEKAFRVPGTFKCWKCGATVEVKV